MKRVKANTLDVNQIIVQDKVKKSRQNLYLYEIELMTLVNADKNLKVDNGKRSLKFDLDKKEENQMTLSKFNTFLWKPNTTISLEIDELSQLKQILKRML